MSRAISAATSNKGIAAPVRGFLIIEALIALAIATTFSLIFAHFQWTSIRHEQEADDYLQAVTLATACIERVQANRQCAQGASHTEGKFTISWKSSVVYSKLADADRKLHDVDFKTHGTWFDVTVSWILPDKRERSITIPAGVLIGNEAGA